VGVGGWVWVGGVGGWVGWGGTGFVGLVACSAVHNPPTPSHQTAHQTNPHAAITTHLIAPQQVWVGVVPSGPTGAPLNSSYNSRGDPRYKDDLGNALVNFARVVPDGLLVFFPAYAVMAQCIEHWKASPGGCGGGVAGVADALL